MSPDIIKKIVDEAGFKIIESSLEEDVSEEEKNMEEEEKRSSRRICW